MVLLQVWQKRYDARAEMETWFLKTTRPWRVPPSIHSLQASIRTTKEKQDTPVLGKQVCPVMYNSRNFHHGLISILFCENA